MSTALVILNPASLGSLFLILFTNVETGLAYHIILAWHNLNFATIAVVISIIYNTFLVWLIILDKLHGIQWLRDHHILLLLCLSHLEWVICLLEYSAESMGSSPLLTVAVGTELALGSRKQRMLIVWQNWPTEYRAILASTRLIGSGNFLSSTHRWLLFIRIIKVEVGRCFFQSFPGLVSSCLSHNGSSDRGISRMLWYYSHSHLMHTLRHTIECTTVVDVVDLVQAWRFKLLSWFTRA